MSARLKRKSFFMDEKALRRARKAVGARSDAETVRLLVQQAAESDRFWRMMNRTRGSLKPGSFGPV